jgi:hypothetical protein
MAARMPRQRLRPGQLAYGAYLIEAAACYVHGGCVLYGNQGRLKNHNSQTAVANLEASVVALYKRCLYVCKICAQDAGFCLH